MLLTLIASVGLAACSAPSAFVRVDRLGYVANEPKRAYLLASAAETGATFALLDVHGATVFSGPVGASVGSWSSTFTQVYALDLPPIVAEGVYSIAVNGPIAASSPLFKVARAGRLYKPLMVNALDFFQAQRDGPNVVGTVLNRLPSHLVDQAATIYTTPTYVNDVLQGNLNAVGGPRDVSGGWFDAGDYLKFVETASYVEPLLLEGVRDEASLQSGGAADFEVEARFELDWLTKMWDDATRTLYYQVGIGDGNGATIFGDHDFWRLPEDDDALNVALGDPSYFVKFRPLFRAAPSGSSISPNLAGRMAASFALGYQVYRASDPSFADACLLSAEHIFDLAQTANVGALLSTAPNDYYPESEWREDLELGAAELYFALALGSPPPNLPHTDPNFYLQSAAQWASAYLQSAASSTDPLNLYEQAGFAHYELVRAIHAAGNPSGLAVTSAQLVADMHARLAAGAARAASDPFGFVVAYGQFDAATSSVGYALEASLYRELSGDASFATLATRQLDWLFGANAWGASFVVGSGANGPVCVHHQIANLVGSLSGGSPKLVGALVGGPNAASEFNGLGSSPGQNSCPIAGGDVYSLFTGHGARYLDNVIAWPSVEPAIDYVAPTVWLFARKVAGK